VSKSVSAGHSLRPSLRWACTSIDRTLSLKPNVERKPTDAAPVAEGVEDRIDPEAKRSAENTLERIVNEREC
jgi:hypothetical protein